MSLEAITVARKLSMNSRDKFVLLALADYANDANEAYPKQSTIAEWTCLSRGTVNAALKSLEESGLIVAKQTFRDDGGLSVKVYHLAFMDTPLVRETYKGMSDSRTSPCTPDEQPLVREMNSKNPQEGTPKKEPKKTSTRARGFDPLEVELPPTVSQEAWAKFVAYRKELKKRLTADAVNIIFNKIAETPSDADAMLLQTIERGWTGVFPVRHAKSGANGRASEPEKPRVYAPVTADDLLEPTSPGGAWGRS